MRQTLLVIDDGENMEMLLSRISQQYLPDLRIISAKTGGEGLKMAHMEKPDAVLLDIKLPDIDGFEVCRQLRADPATKELRILMLSGVMREPADVVRGEQCGADDYIFKPFVITDLVSRLKSLLRIK